MAAKEKLPVWPSDDARQYANLGFRGDVMTKMSATSHVEFELLEPIQEDVESDESVVIP